MYCWCSWCDEGKHWCFFLHTGQLYSLVDKLSTYLIADSLFLVASVICTGRVLEEREESPGREWLFCTETLESFWESWKKWNFICICSQTVASTESPLLSAYQREQLGYENALTLLSSISRDLHVDGLRDKVKETWLELWKGDWALAVIAHFV